MGRGPVENSTFIQWELTHKQQTLLENLEQFKNRHFEKCRIKLVADIDCQIQRWCWKVRSGVRTGLKFRPLFQNYAKRSLMTENQSHFLPFRWYIKIFPKSCMILDFWIYLVQEDGVVFREESGGNNERIGQYRFELDNTFFGQIDLEPISNYIYQFVFNIFAAATSTTLARLSLLSTLLALMVSGSQWHWAAFCNIFKT